MILSVISSSSRSGASSMALRRHSSASGLSGFAGGKLARLVDFPIVAENDCIEQVEDVHLILEHMITTALRERIRAAATVAETETMATAHV